MSDADWHARWREGRIGFHRADAHPMLVRHWPPAGVGADATVFVPLAGKSVDMHWLAARGHRVIGVELSPIAVRAFFDEAGVTPRAGSVDGIDYLEYGRVRLYAGDLFELTANHVDGVTAGYDRAALVALDPPTRRQYAVALRRLLAPGSTVLLITVDYPQHEMDGPPFAVPPDEVQRLFDGAFDVTPVETVDIIGDEPRFRERGVTEMRERAWRLVRAPQK